MKKRPDTSYVVIFSVFAVVSLALCALFMQASDSLPFVTPFPGLGLLLALGVLFLFGLRLHSRILMLVVALYVISCILPIGIGLVFFITPLFFIGAWIGESSMILMRPFFLMGPYAFPTLAAALLLSDTALLLLLHWSEKGRG